MTTNFNPMLSIRHKTDVGFNEYEIAPDANWIVTCSWYKGQDVHAINATLLEVIGDFETLHRAMVWMANAIVDLTEQTYVSAIVLAREEAGVALRSRLDETIATKVERHLIKKDECPTMQNEECVIYRDNDFEELVAKVLQSINRRGL